MTHELLFHISYSFFYRRVLPSAGDLKNDIRFIYSFYCFGFYFFIHSHFYVLVCQLYSVAFTIFFFYINVMSIYTVFEITTNQSFKSSFFVGIEKCVNYVKE